jgi:hypothetical protein
MWLCMNIHEEQTPQWPRSSSVYTLGHAVGPPKGRTHVVQFVERYSTAVAKFFCVPHKERDTHFTIAPGRCHMASPQMYSISEYIHTFQTLARLHVYLLWFFFRQFTQFWQSDGTMVYKYKSMNLSDAIRDYTILVNFIQNTQYRQAKIICPGPCYINGSPPTALVIAFQTRHQEAPALGTWAMRRSCDKKCAFF